MKNLDPAESQWAVQALARGAGTYAVIQGAGIIWGGAGRWVGRGFATAMQVPKAPESWGTALLALGIVVIVTTAHTTLKRFTAYALFLVGVWAFFFGIALTVTVLNDPHVATTGPPTYFGIAVGIFVLTVVYYRSRKAVERGFTIRNRQPSP